MRLWLALRSRLRSLFFRDRREADLAEEVQFHLERETERLQADGLPYEAARLRARQVFGGVEAIKDACRDARGTGFIDETARDVLYALRGFRRAPLVAFTVVATVGLGLGLVTAAFTFLNAFLFRVDQVPDVHELFALQRLRTTDEPPAFTRDEFDALRRDGVAFTEAYAQLADVEGRLDGRVINGSFVTGNFFQVLRVEAAQGRALTPADDAPDATQPVMVLSHRGWDRLFARDPGVVGRRVLVNGVTFEIVGVMPEGFRGLTIAPDDYWAPLSIADDGRPRHRRDEPPVGVEIIGRLKPGLSRQAAVAQLAVWEARQPGAGPIERGAPRVALLPRRGTVQQPAEAVLVTAPMFFAFGLILLTACANVANLLLARGVTRRREIGIRLSLGAARRRVVRQLLTENLLLALAAAGAGLAISRVALETIVTAVMTTFPPEIGDVRLHVPDADWRVLLFLVAGAGASTLAFALGPALRATRLEQLRTIRGELPREARPGRIRDVLIALQVGASALLLIGAAIFLRSTFAAATANPGLRIADTLVIAIPDEATRTPMVQAVMSDPSVAAVAASWPVGIDAPQALAETDGTKGRIAYRFVSPEYFGVLDIAILRGRGFGPGDGRARLPVAMVSETAARALSPDADAIGQVLRLDPESAQSAEQAGGPSLPSRTVSVVGIVRDVPGFRVAPFPAAVIYLPTTAETAGTALVARAHGDPETTRKALLTRLSAIDPTMTQVMTIKSITRMETYFLQIAFWFTVVLGGLALALTLSGLFSVLSYLVEQRAREIGVRMALGATTGDVARLVLSQSLRPVGIGLLLGGGSSAGLAAVLLATPAAAGLGNIVQVGDPVAYTVSVTIIVAACLTSAAIPATRAARLNPAETLRQE